MKYGAFMDINGDIAFMAPDAAVRGLLETLRRNYKAKIKTRQAETRILHSMHLVANVIESNQAWRYWDSKYAKN